MNPPQDLQNRYFQPAMPPHLLTRTEPREPNGSSLSTILFWICVGMALMIFAFYLGVLAPILNALKRGFSKQKPTQPAPLTFEIIEVENQQEQPEKTGDEPNDTDAEQEIDRRFSTIADKYGLLEKAQNNGHFFGMNPANDKSSKDDGQ